MTARRLSIESVARLSFDVPGNPVGKPRMTRRDQWQRRPPVVAYRAWADLARLQYARAMGRSQPTTWPPAHVRLIGFFSIPTSWSARRRAEMTGQPHRVVPDVDNIGKALLDALLEQDQGVYHIEITKAWDDGKGPRLQVTLEF